MVAIGMVLRSKDLARRCLRALPPKFDGLVTVLTTAVTTTPLTFEEFSSMIMEEELRQKVRSSTNEANAVNEKGKGKAKDLAESFDRKKKMKCFYFFKKGHMAKECQKKQANAKNGTLKKLESANATKTTEVELFIVVEESCNMKTHDDVGEDDFKGKPGQLTTARIAHGKAKRVALIGLGKTQNAIDAIYTSNLWRLLGSTAAKLALQKKLYSMGIAVVDTEIMTEESKLSAVDSITSGTILGTYVDTRFKSESKPSKLDQVVIISLGVGSDRNEAIQKAVCITGGVIVTKQLVAAPANVLTPGALAGAAISIAMAQSDVLSTKILERDDCEAFGMGAFLGVANASELPPKFIHMKYTPTDGVVYKRVAIVGKGICFDSGGYNLKVSSGSHVKLIKNHMGGAGASLGAASAIGSLKPAGVEVHFITAVCENMISGKGMHPGDVVTASNGKTIEVVNTDAEGKLTLADALVYACGLCVDAVLDIATLANSCISTLGHDVAGLFTPSNSMADELMSSASMAGEEIWRLPMVESYRDSLNSPIADLVNSSGNDGVSIKAALFLKEFINEGIEWAHLDISGPAWNWNDGTATGSPVRTIVKWVTSQSQ